VGRSPFWKRPTNHHVTIVDADLIKGFSSCTPNISFAPLKICGVPFMPFEKLN